jgi:predicted  nucleic acid-binding Zn-ribbon protein
MLSESYVEFNMNALRKENQLINKSYESLYKEREVMESNLKQLAEAVNISHDELKKKDDLILKLNENISDLNNSLKSIKNSNETNCD